MTAMPKRAGTRVAANQSHASVVEAPKLRQHLDDAFFVPERRARTPRAISLVASVQHELAV
jgi:hypothetical protein